jgi:GNAT superfamily N-acetyltransferase
LDAGVAEGDTEGSGDDASDDDGLCGVGEEGRDGEGEEESRRFAVVRLGHELIVRVGWGWIACSGIIRSTSTERRELRLIGMAMIQVRPAAGSDIETIVRIGPCAPVDQSRRMLIESAVDRGECLLALDDGIPLGYGVMNHSFFNRGFVSLIYVDAAHRRRRVGTALFDEFEQRCRSSRIFTSANLSNLAMGRFLASRGYVVSGVVQDLDENDPEIFYSKNLR